MKKLIVLFITCLIVFSSLIQINATSLPTISGNQITAAPGDTISLQVTLTANPGFCYLKLRYSFNSDALTLKEIINGNVSTDAFSVTPSAILWDTEQNTKINGTLCTFVFSVNNNANGDYRIGLNVIQCFNYDEKSVSFNVNDGKITVTKQGNGFLPGDVNLDGKVKTEDARLALRQAIGLENYSPDSASFRAADVDADKTVTTKDARTILRVAIGLETL